MADRFMMATHAFHSFAGDISRDHHALAVITDEDEQDFIGQWVEGAGFIEVRFPKGTTRELTAEEIEQFNGRMVIEGVGRWTIQIAGGERRD